MTTAPHENTASAVLGGKTIFDCSQIDLSACHATKERIAEFNPHRHEMALLDRVIWSDDAYKKAVAVRTCRDDEFWVRGHFPEMPLFPGVLMVECGAQLACYMFNAANPKPRIAVFLRIQDAAFRRSVSPGETLYILCEEIKRSRRRFVSQVQGVVTGGEIAFEAQITGMSINEDD